MKNTVLIHIGYHKTGSTWLRNEIFIDESDIFSPIKREHGGHSQFADHFVCDEEGYILNSFDTNEKVLKQNQSEILSTYKGNKIKVISHERLSGNPHSAGFDASIIANRIKTTFPNGKILIVIREQKSFILSNYFQYLSIGGTFGIKRYLTTKYDGVRPKFSPNHIDYYGLISTYQELFGKENVLVLPYEMFNTQKELFFKFFGDFLGAEVKIDEDRFQVKRNKKKKHFINYHLRFLNRFVHATSVNNHSFWSKGVIKYSSKALIKFFQLFSTTGMDKKTINKIKDYIDEVVGNRYEESNKKVSQLIDIDLSKYKYY